MRVPMVNHTAEPRRVSRGAIVYAAAPGEVVQVYPMDIPRLLARGFDHHKPGDTDEESTLDDLTKDELRARLPEGVEVPAKIKKAELVELVRRHLEA